MPRDLWQVVYGAGPGRRARRCSTTPTTSASPARPRTGRLVAARAAERLIGCSLELGGKNPMLVLRDADLDRAAEGAVRACFSSAGQLCVSMERMYVADQIYDRFMERFLRRVEAMQLTTSLDYSAATSGRWSRRRSSTPSTRHVDDARAKGAAVLAGGQAAAGRRPAVLRADRAVRGDAGRWSASPTRRSARWCRSTGSATRREAIARANDGEYGLNASDLHPRRARAAGRSPGQIKCGTVNINEAYGATFGSIDAPMGGMRDSGLGRRQGAEGIQRYTEPQAVGTQRLLPIAPACSGCPTQRTPRR